MYRESPHLPCLICLSVVTVVFQSCVCCSPSLVSFLHLAQEKDFARIRIFQIRFQVSDVKDFFAENFS